MMKSIVTAALLGAATLPAAALAQASAPAAATAPALAAGTKVYGPDGAVVGTIDAVAGDNVVLNTGANKATLPRASFGTGANGPTLAMTKAQVDAAVQQAQAQASAATAAALVAGADVHSTDGVLVGKIDKIDGDSVVIARAAGPVAVPRANLSADAQGVKLLMTAAQFDAAAKAASAATPPATDTNGKG